MISFDLPFDTAAALPLSQLERMIKEEVMSAMGPEDHREAWSKQADQEARDYIQDLEAWMDRLDEGYQE